MRKVLLLAGLLATLSLVCAAELEAGHSAYVIHDGQPLLVDKDPDAGTVAKLKAHREYTVIQISGKWAQLKAGAATGWIYVGNLSREEPPDVNNSAFSTQASATTLSAAARGIDDDAKGYADRKGEAESANDVIWMEQENDAISKADVRAYLKEHKLGDFGGQMKRAFVPIAVLVLFCATGLVDAQFGLPGIPFNPFHAPSKTPDANTVKGVTEMAKGASGISLQDEMKIGGAVAVDIVARNGGLVKDETITHRVAIIGKSLSYYCSRPELNFRFGVLNSGHMNAYSAPGGYVFITRGLYDALPDDQQLAAVLAHEISHVTDRHALKVISRSQFMKGLFDAGGSVSSIPGFDGGVAAITDSLFTKGFDPSAEFEADRDGRSLATKVGYERGALLEFLKELYKTKGDTKDAFPTHPPLSHRIERLEK